MGIIILVGVFIVLVTTYILAINFPALADTVITATDAIVFYIGQAMGIVWIFIPKTITLTLGGLAIAVQIIVLGYKFVMWILRKVPVASID